MGFSLNKYHPNSEIERETEVERPDITTKGKEHVFSDCTKRISLTGRTPQNDRGSERIARISLNDEAER